MKVRAEKRSDIKRVEEIIISAFSGHPYSNQKEHLLVARLRSDEALTVSLVAETKEDVVGHISFSEVSINGEYLSWFGLAPVSVAPEYQNQGIGSQLIHAGLEAIKAIRANGCVVLGEPDFYCRFGFRALPKLSLAGVSPEYFLTLAFSNEIPSGMVEFHKAFKIA